MLRRFALPLGSLVFPFAFAAALALAPTGCGGSSSSAMTPDQLAMRDRAAVDRVLQSSAWRVTSWRPDTQLEAMFQELLGQQFSTMTVRFQNGRIVAESPTIHVNRAYSVTEAAGPQFTVIATDENGVPLKTVGQISDDGMRIDFRGETDPWRGYGQLTKIR